MPHIGEHYLGRKLMNLLVAQLAIVTYAPIATKFRSPAK
jgi:hypothetical protein